MLGCERAGKSLDRSGAVVGEWGGGWEGGSAEPVERQEGVVRSSALASVHLRHLKYVRGGVPAPLGRSELRGGTWESSALLSKDADVMAWTAASGRMCGMRGRESIQSLA